MNTNLYRLIVATCAVIFTVESCQAAPPPSKPSPSQTPPIVRPVYVVAANGFVLVDPSESTATVLIKESDGGYSLVENLPVYKVYAPSPGPSPPGPQPPGPTPLNARGAKYRDLALVAADATRAATAQKLAAGYLAVANGSYPDNTAMATATAAAAANAIPSNAVSGWQSFRGTLTEDWKDLLRLPSTNADFASLLRDAAAGLTASTLTP